jgi:hypothetical protein
MMEFSDWMNQQFITWRGKTRRTVTEFAAFIGVKQQVMSSWMKPDGKAPNASSLAKIAAKLGLEVYDVLGLPRPVSDPFAQLPPVLRTKVEAALAEINSIYQERGISVDSAEAEEIADKVFSRIGLIKKSSSNSE